MRDRYRPLLDRIASADDLHDVLWELQGEMGSSHTGVLPPGSGGDPALAQCLLGADLERAEDGTWRIARILPGESSVIGARSPLAAPGVAAAPGDLIVAVDGRPVDPDLGPNALLAGKADKPVELTLRRDGADRRAVVVPLASEHAARYYDLVARQRAAVREASGGRLGYLKIPGMNPAGWAEFHRDLYTEFPQDGLIVAAMHVTLRAVSKQASGADIDELVRLCAARAIRSASRSCASSMWTMSSTNSLILSSAAGTGTRTATPSAMVVTAAVTMPSWPPTWGGWMLPESGRCPGQALCDAVVARRQGALRQHGSARVLSWPYLRRCPGVATSLDYQNATLKIVSGRLGSLSGRSGRLRGVIAKSPGQMVGGAAGVR